MIFYHVTLKNNLDNILKNGLIPQIGTLSQAANETINRIYLFPTIDDMNTALSSWLGETIDNIFGETTECCSLQINLPDNFPVIQEDVPYEAYSYIPIPPEYISYFKDE